MKKKTFQNVNLTCVFQNTNPFDTETSLSSKPSALSQTVLSGLFSHNDDGTFSFEEVIPKTRDVRNAKLFDGKHISMVRMKNGKLQIHFKVMDSIGDPHQLAESIYREVSTALNSII